MGLLFAQLLVVQDSEVIETVQFLLDALYLWSLVVNAFQNVADGQRLILREVDDGINLLEERRVFADAIEGLVVLDDEACIAEEFQIIIINLHYMKYLNIILDKKCRF